MPTALHPKIQSANGVVTPRDPLTAWHLLSLDAPTVAILWTAFFARTTHTPLPPTLLPAMFLAVWLLYAADRLLDARLPHQVAVPTLEPRHLFHRVHARAFTVAMVAAALALIPLVQRLPPPVLRPYFALAALLAIWFALVHAFRAPATSGWILPKELAAAAFFAAATALPSRNPPLTSFLFGTLCALNLFLISHWERSPRHTQSSSPVSASPVSASPVSASPVSASPVSASPDRLLALAALALTFFPLTLLNTRPTQTPCLLALSSAAFALLLVHSFRARIARTTLRALADLALLTPALIWPWLR